MKILKQEFNWNSDSLYHVMVFLLMASIPLSKYTTSMSQMGLTALWLWHGVETGYLKGFSKTDWFSPSRWLLFVIQSLREIWKAFIAKWKAFFGNKEAMVLASLYLMLIVGLLWTSDFNYALKDLRTKVPLIILPLFLATGPKIKTKTLHWMLLGYSLALFGGTLYRLILLYNLEITDPRNIYAHMSHIRFSLNLVMSIFSLLYMSWKRAFEPLWMRTGMVLLAFYFALFMIYMQYDTGVALMVIVAVIVAFVAAFRQSGLKSRYLLIAVSLLIFIIPVVYVSSVVREFRSVKPVYIFKLDQYTSNGNLYQHDTTNFLIENGEYPGLYICDKELRREWEKRSRVSFDGFDQKEQLLRSTLIRYLASKGLRKDSLGISNLSDNDIHAIESGVTSFKNKSGFNIKTQVYNYLLSYSNYHNKGDPNAGSLVQRIEYWRTSLFIIQKSPWFGVGTGDIPSAFERQYNEMNSPLKPEFRKRSHNQYLSTLVAFGIFGFVWFVFALLYPAIKLNRLKQYYYLVFFIVVMVSMLTEDTIESQEGVTFFAFFTCLFLLAWKYSDGVTKNIAQIDSTIG